MSGDLLTGDTKDEIEGVFFPPLEDNDNPTEWEPVTIRIDSEARPSAPPSLLRRFCTAFASCFRSRPRVVASVYREQGSREEGRTEDGA